MDKTDIERAIGRLEGTVGAIGEHLKAMDIKFDKHVSEEEKRLSKIEKQLSLAHFVVLLVKAAVLTVVALLTLKLGDVKSLWHFYK